MQTAARHTGAREQTSTLPSPRRRGTRPVITAALASLVLTGLACTSGPAGAVAFAARARTAAAVTAADTLTAAEAASLVDRVPPPVLHWTTCQQTDQCATAELPLDYHHPRGAKIKLALLRIKAKDPMHRGAVH